MSKTPAPFEWTQIENDIRRVLQVTAKSLGTYGIVSSHPEKSYLGIDDEVDFDLDSDMDSVDITRHRIHSLTRRCYDYSYQLDGYDKVDEDDWHEATALIGHALPEYVADGTESPLMEGMDSPLRVMLETFHARFMLVELSGAVSIQQLALLSNMTVPAVRSSLSKEGFRLERSGGEADDRVQLPAGDAQRWLSKRRGFIPTRGPKSQNSAQQVIRDLVLDTELEFSKVLAKAMDYLQPDIARLAIAIEKDEPWVASVMGGNKADIDIFALRRLAIELGAPEAQFVGRMVTHLLSGSS